MNHGWVPRVSPEPDDYLDRVDVAIDRRPDTEMVTTAFVTTLRELIKHLDDPSTRPIGDLVVAGHATRMGQWSVSPFTGESTTDFESLVDALSDSSKSIKVPDVLIGFDPAVPNPPTHFFHVKGCNIGKSPEFLKKLRQALGGRLTVTAPKHYHGVTLNGDPGGSSPLECIEWMAYEFIVWSKKPLASKKKLIDAFHAANFTLVNNDPIPLATWKAWLAPFGRNATKLKQDGDYTLEKRMPLGQKIGGRKTAKGDMAFIVVTPRTWPLVPYTLVFDDPAAVPPDDTAKLTALKAALKADTDFQPPPAHDWPVYKRIGYSTFDEMWNGLEWIFSPTTTAADGKRHLAVIGGRYEYELQIPIMNPTGSMDPSKGRLIFNHLPETGTPVVTPAIVESDPAYFGSAP